jgi:hypothetical protein
MKHVSLPDTIQSTREKKHVAEMPGQIRTGHPETKTFLDEARAYSTYGRWPVYALNRSCKKGMI